MLAEQIRSYLAQFQPYHSQRVVITQPYFSKAEQSVGEFVGELAQTMRQLEGESNPAYAEIYAKKLLDQFNALQQQLPKLQQPSVQFQSSYSFSPKIHRLPPAKRLAEYRKALRALNEKISWLSEQLYQTEQAEQQAILHSQLAETEFRKQKCLIAIETLEEELRFR